MPTVPTDRSGLIIEFRDEMTANLYADMQNQILDGDESFNGGGSQVLLIFPWGGTVYLSVSRSITDDPQPPMGSGFPLHYSFFADLTLQAHPSLSPVTTSVTLASYTVPSGGFSYGSATATCNVSCDVQTDEYLYHDYLDPTEAVYYPDPSDPQALPFPITGGNAMPDSIPARKAKCFVVPREGEDVTVTATVGGTTLTQTFPWYAGDPWYHGMAHVLTAYGSGAAGVATAAPTVSDVPLFQQSTHTHTESGVTWSANGTLSLTVSGTPAVASAELDADAEIPTVYDLKAKIVGADGANYPDGVTLNYTGGSVGVSGGTVPTTLITQRSFLVLDYLGSTLVDGEEVSDEKGYVTAHLSDLQDVHLDKRDWRLRFLTWRCAGLDVSQDASATVSGTWSGGAAGGIGYVLS